LSRTRHLESDPFTLRAYCILLATVTGYVGGGNYLVTPAVGAQRARTVSGDLIVSASVDGPAAMFRGEESGGSAAREIARAKVVANRASKEKIDEAEVVRKRALASEKKLNERLEIEKRNAATGESQELGPGEGPMASGPVAGDCCEGQERGKGRGL
jgi:hypothetical protein